MRFSALMVKAYCIAALIMSAPTLLVQMLPPSFFMESDNPLIIMFPYDFFSDADAMFRSIIFISILCIPFFIKNINASSRETIIKYQEQKMSTFQEGQENLKFKLRHGIEGISTLQSHTSITVELRQADILFYESTPDKYSGDTKSASLSYDQIINAEVTKREEFREVISNPRTKSKRVASEIISYCIITYSDKDGSEKELSFKQASFAGDFDLFMMALKSKFMPKAQPTHTEL